MNNEEIANKVVMVVCNSVKQMLIYSAQRRLYNRNRPVKPKKVIHGKQNIKELLKQNKQLATVDISHDNSLQTFKKCAKEYGVDFAVKQNPQTKKYVVFFKMQDESVMQQVWKNYSVKMGISNDKDKSKDIGKTAPEKSEKPSILGKLKENEEKIQQSKNKENTLEKAGEKLKNVTKSAELENSL